MNIDNQPHCQLEYDPQLQCVIQTWHGFASSEKFRETINKSITFAQTNPVCCILSDTREQKVVAVEDINWLSNVGTPQLVDAGVKKLAFIIPKDVFTRMGENTYATQAKGQIEIRSYANIEDAKAWFAE